jgi:hypothetical protein
MVSSYLGERSDYTRTLPQPASRNPERTGVAGLGEMRFTDASGTRLSGWYAPAAESRRDSPGARHGRGSFPARSTSTTFARHLTNIRRVWRTSFAAACWTARREKFSLFQRFGVRLRGDVSRKEQTWSVAPSIQKANRSRLDSATLRG